MELFLVGLVLVAPLWGRATRLDLHHQSIRLPGAPAAVVPADLNGDGRLDLAVAVVYTEWDQLAIEEWSEMDQVEGLVEVLTIVPALTDRRELWVYLAQEGNGYRSSGRPVELPLSVLSLMPGPAGLPLLALTDGGLSAVRLDAAGDLQFEPVVEEPTVIAGTGVFLPDLGLVHDLTGDGLADVLLPGVEGVAVYAGSDEGLELEPRWRGAPPGEQAQRQGRRMIRRYPLPEVRDVTADGRPDLVWRHPDEGWEETWIHPATGAGQFGGAVRVELPERQSEDEEIVFFGNVDGDGRAEIATQEELDLLDDDAGMRAEIREAEAPPKSYRLYRVDGSLRGAAAPYTELDALGYAFEDDGDGDIQLPGGFMDIDGDGRQDLVTMTLQISVVKILGGLAAKRLTLPMDFHVWCQRPDGTLAPVHGLDLSGKFKIRFDEFKLRSMPMFGGDFDGDGLIDFVQLGRGRTMGIHAGQPGCSYPTKPDLAVKLKAEPAHVELVRIRDLDGDGRSDVLIVQPGTSPEAGVTAPVTLELYLSAGESG